MTTDNIEIGDQLADMHPNYNLLWKKDADVIVTLLTTMNMCWYMATNPLGKN
jgi:hypothetical protein